MLRLFLYLQQVNVFSHQKNLFLFCFSLNLHYLCARIVMKADGFESFFRGNYPKAFYLALRHLHDEEVCRDLVADAFEHVWKKVETSDEDIANMDSYLFTTVRNRCIGYLRKQQTVSKFAKMELHSMERCYEENFDFQRRELYIEEVMKALDELTPKTRHIVKACYGERKKYREVASELAISESTVKKHIMQALSFLRQKFKGRN